MLDFTKKIIVQKITQIKDQNDLLNLAAEYNGSKIKFEKPNLIFDMDCFVDGEESTISVFAPNDGEIEYDIWIDGDEFFIDSNSELKKFN